MKPDFDKRAKKTGIEQAVARRRHNSGVLRKQEGETCLSLLEKGEQEGGRCSVVLVKKQDRDRAGTGLDTWKRAGRRNSLCRSTMKRLLSEEGGINTRARPVMLGEKLGSRVYERGKPDLFETVMQFLGLARDLARRDRRRRGERGTCGAGWVRRLEIAWVF